MGHFKIYYTRITWALVFGLVALALCALLWVLSVTMPWRPENAAVVQLLGAGLLLISAVMLPFWFANK